MDIDRKDRRILSVIDVDARASFKEIGKRVRLSKETVIYRMKNLEKKGIVKRYTTLVNFAKLGYTGYGVYCRFQNVSEKLKKEIITYLSKIPELYWIATIGGKYDLVFGVMAKNAFQFNRIYYQILGEYGDHLVDTTIAIRTELRQSSRGYLENKKPSSFQPPYFGKEPQVEELNELDSAILSLLSNHARKSIVDIAKDLEKPASTVALRVKQMEKRGVIQGYSAYIKSQKYGMQSYRLLLSLKNMNEEWRKKIFSYAHTNPHMILAIETVGEWDFEITLEVESHEQLQKEISKLRDSFINIVRNVEFLIMFENDLIYDPYPLMKKEEDLMLKDVG